MKIIIRKKFLFFALLLLLGWSAHARSPLDPPEYIKKEGSFISVPSRVVGIVFSVAGAAVASPLTFFTVWYGIAMDGDLNTSVMQPVALGAVGFGEVGYHLGAAPFYAIKYPLYVGPVAFFRWSLPGDEFSGELAGDPDELWAEEPIDVGFEVVGEESTEASSEATTGIEVSSVEAVIAQEELSQSYSSDVEPPDADFESQSESVTEQETGQEIESELQSESEAQAPDPGLEPPPLQPPLEQPPEKE